MNPNSHARREPAPDRSGAPRRSSPPGEVPRQLSAGRQGQMSAGRRRRLARRAAAGSRRRGVLLLVVLAMLALFTLLVITFIVTANHHVAGVKSEVKSDTVGVPPADYADRTVFQIIRGSNDPRSPLRVHSQLEDMYGNQSVRGTVQSASTVAGNLIQITANESFSTTPGYYGGCVITFLTGPARHISTHIVDYTNSGTPTFQIKSTGGATPANGDLFLINGPPFSGTGFGLNPNTFAGTRLLDAYMPDPNNPSNYALLYALLPNHTQGAFVPNPGVYDDPAGPGGANEDYDASDYQNMLLALREWNGTASALQTISPSLHQPALVNYWYNQMVQSSALVPWTNALSISDKWQMVIFPNGPDGQLNTNDDTPWGPDGKPGSGDEPMLQLSDKENIANAILRIKRAVFFRPLRDDHPNFTGGNGLVEKYPTDPQGAFLPTSAMCWEVLGGWDTNFDGQPDTFGQWDVDNDGDGVPDSVWVDIGLPVQTARDGRRIKPLVAILCEGLDGRLNLNAHGNARQTRVDRFQSDIVRKPFAVPVGTTTQTYYTFPLGSGCGPAEISLHPLFSADTVNYPDYKRLLEGDVSLGIEGRYGELGRDVRDHTNTPVTPGPGLSLVDDPFSWMTHTEMPTIAWQFNPYADLTTSKAYWPKTPGTDPWPLCGYGSPADLDADGMIALDLRGKPLYIDYGNSTYLGFGEVDDRIDDPYEIDLSLNARNAGVSGDAWAMLQKPLTIGTDLPSAAANRTIASIDAPFTASELERVLRQYDVDASVVPGRLASLTNNVLLTPRYRHLVSTHGFDLPVATAPLSGPEQVSALNAAGVGPRGSLVDVLRAKLVSGGLNPAQLDAAIRHLLPPEFVQGLKMDLNRPLGNGRDDNGNGVVDEPAEAQYDAAWGNMYNSAVQFDLNRDGQINVGDERARQDLARHLYVLMMLLTDDFDPQTPNAPTNAVDRAYAIAQWAVNIVDFRDRDSIMTPFEFDIYPFKNDDGSMDGSTWDVDGVHGATEKLEYDATVPYRGLVWGVERPELLITETLALHDRNTEDTDDPDDQGEDKRTTDTPADTDWDSKRPPQASLFVELYNPGSDRDPPAGEFTTNNTLANVEIDKMTPASGGQQSPVWRLAIYADAPTDYDKKDPDHPFTANRSDAPVRTVYFTSTNPATFNPAISGSDAFYQGATPDPILAIEPGQYAVIGPAKTTPVGRRLLGAGNPRRIELMPSAAEDRVLVEDNSATPTPKASMGEIKKPVAIVIDAPRGLNVSDPGKSYPPADAMTGFYNPVYDTPLDFDPTFLAGQPPVAELKQDATALNFRRLCLQRLADPTSPWNAATNPYLTVDSSPVDLTVFNGQSPGNEPTIVQVPNGYRFRTRERGLGQGANKSNIWLGQSSANQPATTAPTGAADHVFDYELRHSLGYLNSPLSDRWTKTLAAPVAGVNEVGANYASADYLGDPQRAFPWLTWLNRPFVSAHELTLVPGVRSSMLTRPSPGLDYDGFGLLADRNNPNPFNPKDDDPANEFAHLLNLFHSSASSTATPSEPAANLYRLLDYVHVPSRFVGTQTWLDPTNAAVTSGGSHQFRPPFNYVSNYRDPGRVNLNEIHDQLVWQGLMDAQTAGVVQSSWDNFVLSRRRGETPTLANYFNAKYPTLFPQPFRSAASAWFVPIADLRPPDNRDVNATLFREKPSAGGASGKPLFADELTAEHNKSDRNPYFRYQTLNRLGNLTTTRSNVYAVWITVGYFEVEQWRVNNIPTIDAAHPDGWALAAELGADTGEINRHRSFYIIDRTIPVAFERGENHNIENAILVRRFIE